MNIDIKLVNKELNKEEVCSLRFINKEELHKVLDLQEKIMEWIDEKEIYSCSDREYFEHIIDINGAILGCFNEENELIGMGAYIKYGLDEHNYGYDINLSEEDLLKTAQIESTVVHKDYRGNKLQGIICKIIENLALEDKMERIMATVSPKNPYSLNTFLNSGYNKELEKLKYSGVMRVILNKVLLNN